MDVNAGYKQTELGVIPEDWSVESLGTLTDPRRPISYGIVQTGPSVANGVRCVRVLDVNDGRIGKSDLITTSAAISDAYRRTVLKAGDLVMPLRGKVGEIAFADEDLAGCNLTRGVALIAIRPDASASFCKQFISSGATRNRLEQSMNGSALQEVPIATLRTFKIALPPSRAEQEAIAEPLSDADALVESLEKLLAKKRRLKQGAFQELITGKTRLPGFKEDWKRSPLRRFVRNFIVPMRDKPKTLTGEIPWCRIEDFDGTYLTGSKSGHGVDIQTVRTMNLKVYTAGTLLVSCSADLGRCAIVARPLVSNQTFIGLEMDESVASIGFFYYYMTAKAEELNNLSSGTTISYLSREQFEEFVVLVPPSKEEQNAIALVLSDMDSEIAALDAKAAKARNLKQGMMQELLTGRTRLVKTA